MYTMRQFELNCLFFIHSPSQLPFGLAISTSYVSQIKNRLGRCYEVWQSDIYKDMINEETIAMNFWGRVELAQKEAGIPTLKMVCEQAGILYQTIANKRSLGKLPNLLTSCKIAEQVGKSVEWLLYGDEADASTVSDEDVYERLGKDPLLMNITRKLTTYDEKKLKALLKLL